MFIYQLANTYRTRPHAKPGTGIGEGVTKINRKIYQPAGAHSSGREGIWEHIITPLPARCSNETQGSLCLSMVLGPFTHQLPPHHPQVSSESAYSGRPSLRPKPGCGTWVLPYPVPQGWQRYFLCVGIACSLCVSPRYPEALGGQDPCVRGHTCVTAQHSAMSPSK